VQKEGKSAKSGRPVIVVTNDDGVNAEGIISLARALKDAGRVVVVAPDQERSAASHSITLHRPLRISALSRDVYAVDGTPTDCVMLGVHEILKRRPDIVISGINHGANLGDDVHYSGTVSAAFEGGILGIPSVAISLAVKGHRNFRPASRFAAKLVRTLLEKKLPPGIILNVNVPDLPAGRIKGAVLTKQGKRNYGSVIVEKVDPRSKKYYWIGGDESGFEDIEKSDCNAVRDGWISITPLRVNLTDHAALDTMSEWKL